MGLNKERGKGRQQWPVDYTLSTIWLVSEIPALCFGENMTQSSLNAACKQPLAFTQLSIILFLFLSLVLLVSKLDLILSKHKSCLNNTVLRLLNQVQQAFQSKWHFSMRKRCWVFEVKRLFQLLEVAKYAEYMKLFKRFRKPANAASKNLFSNQEFNSPEMM